jgi:hypothetical protein
MFKPDANQCAVILLRALQERGDRRRKFLTRARLSESSLKALWLRQSITREWLDQVNEWLLSAGWIVIQAGGTYGAIKVSVVENWPRVASGHLGKELGQIEIGTFDFRSWNALLDKAAWTDKAMGPKTRKTGVKVSRK